MSTIALSSLRTRAKRLADMENSSFVSDNEWRDYINEGARVLYDLRVAAYGEDYFTANAATFNTVANQDAYSIVSEVGISNFYKLAGVDFVLATNDVKTLRKFSLKDRNRGQTPFSWSSYTYKGIRYRLRGSKLWFSPPPLAVHQIKVWYVPSLTNLTTDASTIDVENNWEEFPIIYAAKKAKMKEESDVSQLDADILRMKRDLEEMAASRDIGEEEQAVDHYSGYSDYDFADIF